MIMSDDHSHTSETSRNNRAQQVLAELAQILFYQPLMSVMLMQIAGTGVITAFLWNTIPADELLVWYAYMVAISITFITTTYIYRRTSSESRKLQHWIFLFPLAGIMLGVGWGGTSLFSNAMTDNTVMVFMIIVVLGVVAAGIAMLAPYLRAFYLFSVLIVLPYTYVLFQQETQLHFYLGIMILMYLAIVLMSGHHMKRAVLQSINLRLENLELVEDLKIKNVQAEQAREIATQADVSKSKFLAAASHDLRQPLHALGLFVDALENRIKYPEVRSIVDNIRISTDALSDLLNSLLDISKLDAGVLEPKPANFQLRPVLKRIETDFSELAQSKSLQLEVIDCNYVVHSDPSMLERILRNLVSNAIRYTRQGSVKLDCQLQENQIVIDVMDTGIGIAKDQQENIFQEFYQIENSERDRRKGLGLGLAIVKRLSDLLNTELTVSSIPEQGSTFRVSVPYVESSVVTEDKLDQVSDILPGMAVLVIDDESMIRLGMTKVLQEWGCEVYEAESISQALELVEKDYEINIILTDYRLRDNENGIDAIEQIHAVKGESIPAIILTGDTDPERLREARDSGFKLLHKPVSPAKLRSLMCFLLEQSDISDTEIELTE